MLPEKGGKNRSSVAACRPWIVRSRDALDSRGAFAFSPVLHFQHTDSAFGCLSGPAFYFLGYPQPKLQTVPWMLLLCTSRLVLSPALSLPADSMGLPSPSAVPAF